MPLTRFLVQGPGVVGVLIALIVLYLFAMPLFNDLLGRRDQLQVIVASMVVGSLVPMAADAAGFVAPSVLWGWGQLVVVPFVLLGLMRSESVINLFLVLPIRAVWFLWGSLALALMLILAGWSFPAFEMLGVWLGTVGWYFTMGPGRRQQRARPPRRESDLEKRRRFNVIEGGNAPGGNDLVN